ncbi:MAG TPA: NAD(P)-dependent oxidoreductase [Crenalkalicoccus sp.]|nr:NAD(P)-dependent oxidoreductase [Crenalkalicoccus sp.]
MNVGWIGLGKLGAPMARHVAAGGQALRALDTNPARLAAVPGAEAAESIAALAAWAEVLVTSLPDDAALRAVALGPQGALAHLAPGGVLAETSTVSPQACAELRAMAEARGALYLAAPVSGSTATAEAAALTLFCSGPAAALERARPVLARFARAIHLVGGREEARYLKLAINHFVGSTAQVAAEALTLARKGGVAWETLLEVLGQSVAASPLIAYKLDPLRRRDFAPAFTVTQMVKDMSLAVAAGEAAGVAMPLAALVRNAFRRQAAGGLAELDFFAALLEAERAAGLGEP